jgi:hypothetical protein
MFAKLQDSYLSVFRFNNFSVSHITIKAGANSGTFTLMQKQTKIVRIVVIAGLLLLCLSALFPLRRYAGNQISVKGRYTPPRAFIYSPNVVQNQHHEVDFARVACEWMFIASFTAAVALCFAAKSPKNAEKQ